MIILILKSVQICLNVLCHSSIESAFNEQQNNLNWEPVDNMLAELCLLFTCMPQVRHSPHVYMEQLELHAGKVLHLIKLSEETK